MRPLTSIILAILYVLVLCIFAGAINRAAKYERDRSTMAYPDTRQETPEHTLLVYITED